MGRRRRAWLLLGGGGLLLAALILRFLVVPALKVLPADLDVVRTYEGTLVTMLDPTTFQFYRDVPVRITRRVRVVRVEGNKALVREQAELYRQDDNALLQSRENHYALDRRTLLPVDGMGEDWHREGLTLNFPIGTRKQDYQGWNEDAQKLATARFVRQERRAGLTTWVFHTQTGPDPIRDPFLLALLPAEIDKGALEAILAQLDLPDLQQRLVAEALPRLPDPVPLNYFYLSDLWLWVEPTTGMAVDFVKHEERLVALGPLPVATIFEMDWRHTPETVLAVAAEARPFIEQVRWFERRLPTAAALAGGVLVFIALGGVDLTHRLVEEYNSRRRQAKD